MNRATRRMMRSQEAKDEIKRLSKATKVDQRKMEAAFEASIDFSLKFYDVGKLHKEQGRPAQSFEQFMYFNKLHELDLAVKGTPASERKQDTENFVLNVVYPAYMAGYDGVPIFPLANLKPPSQEEFMGRVAPELSKEFEGDDEALEASMEISRAVHGDMVILYNEGKKDKKAKVSRMGLEAFVVKFNLFNPGFPQDIMIRLIEMLYGAYSDGYYGIHSARIVTS